MLCGHSGLTKHSLILNGNILIWHFDPCKSVLGRYGNAQILYTYKNKFNIKYVILILNYPVTECIYVSFIYYTIDYNWTKW